MRSIKEWLKEIDKADLEHSPSRRADLSDAFLGELREIFDDDRIEEICKAEKEGRLVVLPEIKINKTLYWIWGNEIMPVLYKGIRGGCIGEDKKYHVSCNMITKKDRTFVHRGKSFTYKAGDKRCFYSDDIGKTVFLTREQALKALGGADNDR